MEIFQVRICPLTPTSGQRLRGFSLYSGICGIGVDIVCSVCKGAPHAKVKFLVVNWIQMEEATILNLGVLLSI